ncbi:hypothetical protein Acr_13g0015920 [Actinidia rufa]|uniref:Retrovirus-related Pol polyprotein from transposon TNT 1-94-like beta-barrel domain-containing protein n=1 Tax=Actinidia rufa TaxID=165716 RepID=A0A7J0FN92_9ERIC|nr:hypothetical protein Acr_13g0015920 [Actinidia rufa]
MRYIVDMLQEVIHAPGRHPTCPHAPGRGSHALPRASRRTHALARVVMEVPHACTCRKMAATATTCQEGRFTSYSAKKDAARAARTSRQLWCPVAIQSAPVSTESQSAATSAKEYFGNILSEKLRMENILFYKDLHDPLEDKGDKPIAMKDDEWKKMNRKTIGLIRQCIGYELKRGTKVAEHTSEFQNLINQLASVDLQFDNEMQAILFLSSLLESWETLVVSLSNSTPNEKLTMSMVMDALFNEKARIREMGMTNQSELQALVSEGSKERGQGQRRGHHRAHDQSSETAATTVMVEDKDESDVFLAASIDGKSDWVLYLGSDYHLCRDRDVFSTYKACEGHVWMTNNMATRVIGKGLVRFCMAGGRSMMLAEILWRSWTRSCQDGQLEDIGLPSNGLEGEIAEIQPTWMSPSPVAKSKPGWGSHGVSMSK